MAKENSEQRHIEKSVERGQRNAELLPKVEAWCKHLEVNMVSSGMLAEMYQLPIGRMDITCPHAAGGGIGAHDLHSVAAYFIPQNCRGCPHHEEISADNVGREILAEADAIEQRRANRDVSVDNAKLKLRGLVSGDLSKALQSESTTQQSILELVALLDDAEHHRDAADKLVLAAEIAPELFTELSREIIASHFPNPDHGRDCIACMRALGRREGRISEVAASAARQCLLEGKAGDDVCALLGDYVETGGPVPPIEIVEAIIAVQHHRNLFSNSDKVLDYTGSNYALRTIAARDLDALVTGLNRRLRINEKSPRIDAACIIRILLPSIPGLVQAMTEPLIESLELDDDHYEWSADAEACNTLAAIYRSHPVETQRRLTAAEEWTSDEVKELMFDVHLRLVFELRREDKARLSENDEACLRVAIPELVRALNASARSAKARKRAAESLTSLARDFPELLLPMVDSFFGSLATLAFEEKRTADEPPSPDPMGRFERRAKIDDLAAVSKEVVELLEELCGSNPREILVRLEQIVPGLSSEEPHEEILKCRLVSLYGPLGKIDETSAAILPALYRALMDFASVKIRGMAVRAAEHILGRSQQVLPENMIDVLILYLNDNYIFIHKSAVGAIEHVTPDSLEQAFEIGQRLRLLYEVYSQDEFFRREIVRACTRICGRNVKLIQRFALPMIFDLCKTEQESVAADALGELRSLLQKVPELAATFVEQVVAFLGRSHRDRFNRDWYSDRHQLFVSLFKQTRESVVGCAEKIKEAALAQAKDDPWEGLQLVTILLHFELYQQAADTARDIASAQPKTRKYDKIVEIATIFSAFAQSEGKIANSSPVQAESVLQEIRPFFEKDESENQNPGRAAASAGALSLAHQIAQRLQQL